MKKKTSNKIIFSLIIVTTVLLVGLGVIFSKSEFEKINGLANVFDVSDDGLLAYVYYEEGKPSIYLNRDDEISQLIQLTDAEEIVDIAFTTNGNEIVYAGTNWEKVD